MYRPYSQLEREPDLPPTFFQNLVSHLFLLGYFTLLPIIVLVIINWAVYSVTANTFYQDVWMMPTLLLLSTFLSGAFMRQKMVEEGGGLMMYCVGLVAFGIFAWLCWQDLQTTGAVFSRFMPKLLKFGVSDYLYILPAVGMVGMLFYKAFSLKHFN